jgi:hypothetical protein
LVVQEKDAPGAPIILTLIALGAIGLLACLDDFPALTVGTLHRDRNQRLPPRADVVYGEHTGKLPICNITVRHSRFARGENTIAELEGKARREGERKSRAGVSTKTLARRRARA